MWGWFFKRNDRPAEVTEDPQFPRAWCVFALLVAATEADAIVTEEEELEVDALLLRARTLVTLSPQDVQSYVGAYRDILRGANSVSPLVTIACEKLARSPGLAESVFAHCVDLVFSDRTVNFDEEAFLNEVAEGLGLSEKTKNEIITVLSWKNAS